MTKRFRGFVLAGILAACALGSFVGCTTEGRVRQVDGEYRKIYPDPKGGYYYVNKHAERVHLDQMPPDDDAVGDSLHHVK